MLNNHHHSTIHLQNILYLLKLKLCPTPHSPPCNLGPGCLWTFCVYEFDSSREPPVSGISHYLSFCVRLISLSIASSRSIHAIACNEVQFCLLCKKCSVYIYRWARTLPNKLINQMTIISTKTILENVSSLIWLSWLVFASLEVSREIRKEAASSYQMQTHAAETTQSKLEAKLKLTTCWLVFSWLLMTYNQAMSPLKWRKHIKNKKIKN